MKQLAFSLIVICASVFINSANPVGAQQFDVQERFDPAQTLGFIESFVDRANCTPICGNPTCCIAFEQRVVTHVSKQSFDEFRQRVQAAGLSIQQFVSAATSDNNLYLEMGFEPVTDIAKAEADAQFLMSEAQELGISLACTPCCSPCGDTVCCGGCWSF